MQSNANAEPVIVSNNNLRGVHSVSASFASAGCLISDDGSVFVNGDGEYRPRIPQYPEIQDILGTAVNAVLVGNTDPKEALDGAEAQAAKLF